MLLSTCANAGSARRGAGSTGLRAAAAAGNHGEEEKWARALHIAVVFCSSSLGSRGETKAGAAQGMGLAGRGGKKKLCRISLGSLKRGDFVSKLLPPRAELPRLQFQNSVHINIHFHAVKPGEKGKKKKAASHVPMQKPHFGEEEEGKALLWW